MAGSVPRGGGAILCHSVPSTTMTHHRTMSTSGGTGSTPNRSPSNIHFVFISSQIVGYITFGYHTSTKCLIWCSNPFLRCSPQKQIDKMILIEKKNSDRLRNELMEIDLVNSLALTILIVKILSVLIMVFCIVFRASRKNFIDQLKDSWVQIKLDG